MHAWTAADDGATRVSSECWGHREYGDTTASGNAIVTYNTTGKGVSQDVATAWTPQGALHSRCKTDRTAVPRRTHDSA